MEKITLDAVKKYGYGFGRDSYGRITLRAGTPTDTHITAAQLRAWTAAQRLTAAAQKIGQIPQEHDNISWDRKKRADGSALHVEVYDFAAAAVIICIRETEGSKYGVATTSKTYKIIRRMDGVVTVADVSLPVAKYAKMAGVQHGEIIAKALGVGQLKLLGNPAPVPEITYKALAIDAAGNLRSIYNAEPYKIGEEKKQGVRAGHEGGYYSYKTVEEALNAEFPGDSELLHQPRVIVRCVVSGKKLVYSGNKISRTSITLQEIVASVIQ
jgi:hypothetical protein